MEQGRQVNMRLPVELVDRVQAVALIEGGSMAALTVEALEALIEQRRGDPDWQQRRRGHCDEHRRLMEALDGG